MESYPRDWSQIELPAGAPHPSRLLGVLITLVVVTILANAALALWVAEAALRNAYPLW